MYQSGYNDIPYVAIIKQDSVVLYNDRSCIPRGCKRSVSQVTAQKNLVSNTVSGMVTGRIKTKIHKIVNNWVDAINYASTAKHNTLKLYPSFVTLTLPSKQIHTDKELNRMALGRFLIVLQRKYNDIKYLWRSERQSNGNIHYHIIIDKYIHYKEIQAHWNKIMNDLGYISAYRLEQILKHSSGFNLVSMLYTSRTADQQFKAYQYGVSTNWSNPNTTDVHSLKNVKNVASYISKYISKNKEYDRLKVIERLYNDDEISLDNYEAERDILLCKIEFFKINSRLWGCSDKLRNLDYVKVEASTYLLSVLYNLELEVGTKVITHDNVTCIYRKNILNVFEKNKVFSKQILEHRNNNFNHIYKVMEEVPLGLSVNVNGELLGIGNIIHKDFSNSQLVLF